MLSHFFFFLQCGDLSPSLPHFWDVYDSSSKRLILVQLKKKQEKNKHLAKPPTWKRLDISGIGRLCIGPVFRGSQNGSKGSSQWIKRKPACSDRDGRDIAHTQTPTGGEGGGRDSDETFWMSDPNRSLIALGTVKSCVHPFADEHTSQSLWLACEAPKWAISMHIQRCI